jgi:hypothetical protein
MMRVLAIDPGPVESAWVLYDPATKTPVSWAKESNDRVRARVAQDFLIKTVEIEMIASYGMAVGAEVFETCVWIGRFMETWRCRRAKEAGRVFRKDVKLHLCGSPRAKDSNIRQAIIDRFGGKEKAIGKKATPGPLYGMKADCWAALAVAITATEAE